MSTIVNVRFRRIIALLLMIFAILAGVYVIWQLDSRPSTDDAYAYADTINVTPEVSGRIISFGVKDNQQVKKGDVLFTIDPRGYQETLNKNEALLQQLEQQIMLTQRSVSAQNWGRMRCWPM